MNYKCQSVKFSYAINGHDCVKLVVFVDYLPLQNHLKVRKWLCDVFAKDFKASDRSTVSHATLVSF
jgi:hypothetical protein